MWQQLQEDIFKISCQFLNCLKSKLFINHQIHVLVSFNCELKIQTVMTQILYCNYNFGKLQRNLSFNALVTYHISGYFCGDIIFAIFVVPLRTWKIDHRKFGYNVLKLLFLDSWSFNHTKINTNFRAKPWNFPPAEKPLLW